MSNNLMVIPPSHACRVSYLTWRYGLVSSSFASAGKYGTNPSGCTAPKAAFKLAASSDAFKAMYVVCQSRGDLRMR